LTSTHFLVDQKNLRFPYAFLVGRQHHHLGRVLRAGPGKRVWLIDEKGGRFLAEVKEVERERTKLIILERQEAERERIRLLLAQAIIKSKKMDLIIQKATELGIASFIPILAARSIVKVKEEEEKVAEDCRRSCQTSSSNIHPLSPPSPAFSLIPSRFKSGEETFPC